MTLIIHDSVSDKSEAVVVLQSQHELLLELLLARILREQKHVGAGVGSWQVISVWRLPLDEQAELAETLDGGSVAASHEKQEGLALFDSHGVQYFPQLLHDGGGLSVAFIVCSFLHGNEIEILLSADNLL